MDPKIQWRKLKASFEEDLDNASKDEYDYMLSEYDDVIIMYKGHFPQFREKLDEIINRHNAFFAYDD